MEPATPEADASDDETVTLAAPTDDDDAPAVRREAPRLGATLLGRYHLDAELGRGGNGIVFVATDTQLQRRVAIKFLRSPDDQRAHARLVREARGLAQIEHPNVIRIFAVELTRSPPFIVMELVDGCDLATWWASRSPSVRMRVDAVLAAGRGLEAAHAAGLVHRDFKPGNVLVATDGAIRVTDFGLVRGEASRTSAEDPRFTTKPRAFVGTPGYAAPEQLVRSDVDARADQFAFCVVLYEALCGRRPFSGSDAGALASAMSTRIVGRLRRSGVSRRLADVVQRGLDPEPSRRFESMTELLQAFAGARRSRLRTIAVLAGVAVIAGLIAGLLERVPAAPAPGASPTIAMASLGTVAADLAEHERATTRERTIAPLREAIDAGRASDAVAQARALLDSLRVRTDPALRDQIALMLGRAELKLGRDTDAERTFRDVALAASARGDFALESDASIAVVDVVGLIGRRHDEAMEWIRRAEVAAERAGKDVAVLVEQQRAALSFQSGDLDAAEASFLHVLELVDDAESETADRIVAVVYNGLGAIHGQRSEFELARASFEAALQQLGQSLPEHDSAMLIARINLGQALLGLHDVEVGRVEEGLAALREVGAVAEHVYGTDHPVVIDAIGALAFAHVDLGECAAAAPLFARALAALERSDAPRAQLHVDLLFGSSRCALALRRPYDAEQLAARAVTLAESGAVQLATKGQAHWWYARAAWMTGRRQPALSSARRALTILTGGGPEVDALVVEIRGWLRERG